METDQSLALLMALTLICPTDCQDQKNVTAEPGQNAVLPCSAAGNKRIIAAQWSRSDLGSDYVLRYRDELLDEENQNPSFRTRVALLDGAVKEGNVSLVLKNLTANDTGEYECRVAQRGAEEAIAIMKLISTVYLYVAPPPSPGNQDGRVSRSHAVLLVALSAAVVIVSMVMITAVRRKKMETRSPPDDETSDLTEG